MCRSRVLACTQVCPVLTEHTCSPPPPQFVTDNHGRLVVLGEGAHAVVYHGRLQGCDVAVKVGPIRAGS